MTCGERLNWYVSFCFRLTGVLNVFRSLGLLWESSGWEHSTSFLSQFTFPDQGALGSLLIKLNVRFAVYRRNSVLYHWPVLEVVGVSAITAAVSYLVSMITRVNKRSMTLIIHRLFSLGT